MVTARIASTPRPMRWIALFALAVLLVPLLAACAPGGGEKTDVRTQVFRQADVTFGSLECGGQTTNNAGNTASALQLE